MATASKSVLVYGGCGGLGAIVVGHFKANKWHVVSVDLRDSDIADTSITIKGDGTKEDTTQVVQKLKDAKIALDAVISVAGGFLMGSIKNETIFAETERMLAFNLKSAIAASHVAAHCLKEGGLLVLTGADSALKPTPTMIGYGVSKAATHHLINSLASPDSGLPKNTVVTAMLPIMLDTPQNRKDMPEANYDNWTPLDHVADLLLNWGNEKDRPANGTLIRINTENKKTSFTPVDL